MFYTKSKDFPTNESSKKIISKYLNSHRGSICTEKTYILVKK